MTEQTEVRLTDADIAPFIGQLQLRILVLEKRIAALEEENLRLKSKFGKPEQLPLDYEKTAG